MWPIACDCECHWTLPGTVTDQQLSGMRAMFAECGIEGGLASEQSAFIRSVVGGTWDWMSQVDSLSREQAGDILYALHNHRRMNRD